MAQVKTIAKSPFPSFDEQAETYDQRVGLSPKVCREIVEQVLAIAQVNPGEQVLEIGAGTGQIGQWFAQYPVQYMGCDLSPGMLEKFQQRLLEGRRQEAEPTPRACLQSQKSDVGAKHLGDNSSLKPKSYNPNASPSGSLKTRPSPSQEGDWRQNPPLTPPRRGTGGRGQEAQRDSNEITTIGDNQSLRVPQSPSPRVYFQDTPNPGNMTLLLADGNQPWFPADGTTRAIFSSRAIHWLAVEHIVQESFRIAQPDGATLLIGRIQRQKESVKTKLQQELQRRLRQHGLKPRGGEHHQRQLIDLFTQRGAKVIKPIVVAQWKVSSTPAQSIKNWQQKPGLSGINLPADLKQNILEDLQNWAQATFGELEQTIESEESYVLQGIRFC
ncbi:MAG: methyltransferase domain-containing protein [Symploca sp. SIO3E6]|nr:methyltransferase domain-containing protein [Caldora sp. SIO3E6]